MPDGGGGGRVLNISKVAVDEEEAKLGSDRGATPYSGRRLRYWNFVPTTARKRNEMVYCIIWLSL